MSINNGQSHRPIILDIHSLLQPDSPTPQPSSILPSTSPTAAPKGTYQPNQHRRSIFISEQSQSHGNTRMNNCVSGDNEEDMKFMQTKNDPTRQLFIPSHAPRSITPQSQHKPILLSIKLFVAVLFVLGIGVFLSLTYILGLTTPNDTDQSINYVPTLQNGYSMTAVNVTTAEFIELKICRSISTLPGYNSLTPTHRPKDFLLLQSHLSQKEEGQLTKLFKKRLLAKVQYNSDLFGFSGLVSNDGLPIFSFVGYGDYLYILHCENLMCSESSIAVVDLSIFSPLTSMSSSLNSTVNIAYKKASIKPDGTIITNNVNETPTQAKTALPIFLPPTPTRPPSPSSSLYWIDPKAQPTAKYYSVPLSLPGLDHNLNSLHAIPLKSNTKILLLPTLKPIILTLLDSGQLFFAVCDSITCQDSLTQLTLIHPAAASGIAIYVNPYYIVMAFVVNYRPHPQIQAGPLTLVICNGLECGDFYYRSILGVYVGLKSSISLTWQIHSGLTVVFPGYWLPTSFSSALIKPFVDRFGQQSHSNQNGNVPPKNSNSNKASVMETMAGTSNDDTQFLLSFSIEEIMKYEIFTTVSMHPLMSIALVNLLYTKGWLQLTSVPTVQGNSTHGGDGNEWVLTCNPFEDDFIKEIKPLVLQFYDIVDAYGYYGNDINFNYDEQMESQMEFKQMGTDNKQEGIRGRFLPKQPVYSVGRHERIQHSPSNQPQSPENKQQNSYHTLDVGSHVENELYQQTLKQYANLDKITALRSLKNTIKMSPSQFGGLIDGVNITETSDHQKGTETFNTTSTSSSPLTITYPSGDTYDIPTNGSLTLGTLTPSEFDGIADLILHEIQLMIVQYSGLTTSYYRTNLADPTVMEPKTIYLTCKSQCRPGSVIITMPLASHPLLVEQVQETIKNSSSMNITQVDVPNEPLGHTIGDNTTGDVIDLDWEYDVLVHLQQQQLRQSSVQQSQSIITTTVAYQSTEIEGRLRDVYTMDGDSKMTVLVLHDEDSNENLPLEGIYIKNSMTSSSSSEAAPPPSTTTSTSDHNKTTTPLQSQQTTPSSPKTTTTPVKTQALSSFGCPTATCQRTKEDTEESYPTIVDINTNGVKIRYSKHYFSLFGGSVGSLTTIIGNMTGVTHIAVDSDPFFATYQYLLFDYNGIPMYARCFDVRCHSMHVQPLMPSEDNSGITATTGNNDSGGFFDLSKSTRSSLMQSVYSTLNMQLLSPLLRSQYNTTLAKSISGVDSGNSKSFGVNNNSNSFKCTSSHCFTLIISPIDSMVLLLVGNSNTSLVHCSNMFCLPYFTP